MLGRVLVLMCALVGGGAASPFLNAGPRVAATDSSLGPEAPTACGVTLCDNPANTTASFCMVTEPKSLDCPSSAVVDNVCTCKFELNVPLIISAPVTCGLTRYPIYTGAKCNTLSLCNVEVYVTKGTITLNGTGAIVAPAIDIFADGLVLEGANAINASFLGYPPMLESEAPCKPKGQPTTQAYQGYGASHAGTGGIGGSNAVTACDTFNTYLTQPQVNNTIIGNAVSPDEPRLSIDSFGSSGGCGHSGSESLCGGRGGGRIRITIEGDTNIGAKSQIVADGASAPQGSNKPDMLRRWSGRHSHLAVRVSCRFWPDWGQRWGRQRQGYACAGGRWGVGGSSLPSGRTITVGK